MIAGDGVSGGCSSLLPDLCSDSVAHPNSELQLISFRNRRNGRN